MQFSDNHPERFARTSAEIDIREAANFLLDSRFSLDVAVEQDKSMGITKKTETLIVQDAQQNKIKLDRISVQNESATYPSVELRFTDLSLTQHTFDRSRRSGSSQAILWVSRLAIYNWAQIPDIYQEYLRPAWFTRSQLFTVPHPAESREIMEFHKKIKDPQEALDINELKEFLDINHRASARALNAEHGIQSTSLGRINKWADNR